MEPASDAINVAMTGHGEPVDNVGSQPLAPTGRCAATWREHLPEGTDRDVGERLAGNGFRQREISSDGDPEELRRGTAGHGVDLVLGNPGELLGDPLL